MRSTMTITPENMKKILLVEDEKIARTINKMFLEEIGYIPDIAENGQQALDLAQKNDYDLILMDIGLPDINGIEVTIKIRAWEKTKRTPIVALTAFATEDTKIKCLQVGMEKVVFKPTDVTTLMQIINQFSN